MVVSILAAVLRILIGAGFLFLGTQKLLNPEFLFGGLLHQVYAIGAPFPIYNQLLERFVELHQEAFAYGVAAAEILLGVILILGGFVSLAAVGGAFLVLNFALATTWGNLTMMAAHLCLIVVLVILGRGGAGLTLGLDALLVKYLPEWLVFFPLRRKSPAGHARLISPQAPGRRK